MQTQLSSERSLWFFSRRADFWLACGGASIGLLAAIILILLRGDRELDAIDFVLSELHLGATYDAILRRRLWHHRQFDVLLIPLVILVLTYAFSLGGQTILLTSITMYAAVWHRGRQSLGVAQFYQRGMGGPVSRTHEVLFRGAIYLPMMAAVLAYTQLAPGEYEGEPYVALNVGAEITWTVGLVAVLWVIAYFVWTLRQSRVRVTLRSASIQASGGWCLRTASPSAAATCSARPMFRFCWFSPCTTKCNISISLTPWLGAQGIFRRRQNRLIAWQQLSLTR